VSFKDLFSQAATAYAQFRPTYPAELFEWVAGLAATRDVAVDLATGNGQAAVALAPHFAQVIGVEPSAQQLANATQAAGVAYRQGSAEATGLGPATADLVTVAQAFHWFKHDAFFAEVRRIGRPGAALAIWCYGLTTITPEVDAAVHELYEGLLGTYWEPERRMVEDGYRSVAVPFEEIPAPAFEMRMSWTFDHLLGYLGTWSPRKKYIERHGKDPIALVLERLRAAWGDAAERTLIWPLSLRAFRIGAGQ
jgi:ubiquinone/menaquinone biosynthesis C-methylase UbiE